MGLGPQPSNRDMGLCWNSSMCFEALLFSWLLPGASLPLRWRTRLHLLKPPVLLLQMLLRWTPSLLSPYDPLLTSAVPQPLTWLLVWHVMVCLTEYLTST